MVMETDVVIAVMGMTRVGKSSFIKNITRRQDIRIGHSLTSETSEVCGYPITHEGTHYTLVDTPGFSDTFESDDVVTENILKWLESSYRSGTKLNGILYLHSIAAPRMAGSAFDNLCMFRKLCGDSALSHVVLATTFWGTSDATVEEQRESTLRQDRNIWGRMVDAGSTLVRLEDTRASALKALRSIASASKVMLQAQHEMINEGKAPKETLAAKFTASCSSDAQFNDYRQSTRRRRREMEQREDRLNEMKANMQAQDETLAQLKQQTEQEQAKLNSKTQNYYETHPCRCSLVGRAKCARCRRSIKGVFYHCCLYKGNTFMQCAKCGNRCPNDHHPEMKRDETYCTVM